MAACSVAPESATNTVGQAHSVTAHLTTNGVAVAGVSVDFSVTSGPNVGSSGSFSTSASGDATFTYTGNGGVGTDSIQATGMVDGVAFTCIATQVWRIAGPSIQCPANIVTNSTPGDCSRSVAYTASASGSPMPTIRCSVEGIIVTSPHLFSSGVTTVSCTASNANGVGSCSFTVTVIESVPPEITCPGDVFVATLPGESTAVVEFDAPVATDNCGDASVACVPPSGSVFSVGTSAVVCTATDNSGNTNICGFAVNLEGTPPETHDLAVTKIRVPKYVLLKASRPAVTKRVVVTIQNRSAHTETIDPAQFEALVTLAVQSLDTNSSCGDIVPVFLQRRPQKQVVFNLKSKRTLNVYFEVTFDCAVNPAKTRGQGDFRYVAIVNHAAIDGVPDTHPECDVCPRPPLEGGFDPNPNGKIRDRGCGASRGDRTFGNDVLTDVIVK